MKEGKKYVNCLLLSRTSELDLTLFERDELSKRVEENGCVCECVCVCA